MIMIIYTRHRDRIKSQEDSQKVYQKDTDQCFKKYWALVGHSSFQNNSLKKKKGIFKTQRYEMVQTGKPPSPVRLHSDKTQITTGSQGKGALAPSHLSDGTMVVVRRIPTTAGATAPHGIQRSEAQGCRSFLSIVLGSTGTVSRPRSISRA